MPVFAGSALLPGRHDQAKGSKAFKSFAMRFRLQVPGSAAFRQEGAHLFRTRALFPFDILFDGICLMVSLTFLTLAPLTPRHKPTRLGGQTPRHRQQHTWQTPHCHGLNRLAMRW